MISEPNEMIEQYLLGKLKGNDRRDFELKLKESPKLAFETKLMKDIISSVTEKDVMELRNNLSTVLNENINMTYHDVSFDLAQNMELCADIDFNPDDLLAGNPLQQIHTDNHLKNAKGRTHQIDTFSLPEEESIFSNAVGEHIFWNEIQAAVMENDVIDLRNNLTNIINQENAYFSDFEIDQFLSNELDKEQTANMGNMAKANKHINAHIKLHREIDEAINESDILELRSKLSTIIQKEQKLNLSEIKKIDDYLLDYLDEKDRSEFEEKMNNNIQLEKEVQFNREINESITESDILSIRASLNDIIDENRQPAKIRRLIPVNYKNKPLQLAGAAASIAAVISAGVLSLNHENMDADKLFRQSYKPYDASGLFRSATTANPAIIGVDLYNAHRYDDALAQFSEVLKENSEHPMGNFFAGLCYMEKNQFSNAVESFQKVIDERDNLFIEQAQWYMSLGLLGENNENEAYKQLNKIVLNNGYYKKEAKELLKKLK